MPTKKTKKETLDPSKDILDQFVLALRSDLQGIIAGTATSIVNTGNGIVEETMIQNDFSPESADKITSLMNPLLDEDVNTFDEPLVIVNQTFTAKDKKLTAWGKPHLSVGKSVKLSQSDRKKLIEAFMDDLDGTVVPATRKSTLKLDWLKGATTEEDAEEAEEAEKPTRRKAKASKATAAKKAPAKKAAPSKAKAKATPKGTKKAPARKAPAKAGAKATPKRTTKKAS